MKLAILFSGRIRKFGNHYNNIMENIVQGNDVDFYLSHSPEVIEDLDSFCELYKPVAVCDDPIPEFDHSKYKIFPEFNTKPRNIWCMFYNRKRVFNLLESNSKEYDCIISYRLDALAHEPLNLDLVKENITGIFIPEGFDHCGGINDQIAYGAYEPMRVYLNTLDSMINVLENGCYLLPELINRGHLEKSGIPIIRVKFDYELINSTYIIT
jgi:hypothetical protein